MDLAVMQTTFAGVLKRSKAAARQRGYLDLPVDIAPHCIAFHECWHGRAPLVPSPDSAEKVAAAIVRIVADVGKPVVPQGGNTGVTDLGQPHAHDVEVVRSTSRLNRIRAVDPRSDSSTAKAGVALAEKAAAAKVNRLLPLGLTADGSRRIGGDITTNDGGTPQRPRYAL